MAKKTTREKVEELWPIIGNQTEIARQIGVARQTVQAHVNNLGLKPVMGGYKDGISNRIEQPPEKGVRRFLLTCAQNNTPVNKPLWANLMALARHYKIKQKDILVSRFAYNVSAYTAQPEKPGFTRKRGENTMQDELWYDPLIAKYVCDDRVEIAPGLIFCGEMNISPTAVRPLTGYESYTARKSGIFPHVKIALQSVASAKDEPTKFNYTTGTVTKMNYIKRSAGLKAEFHHCYGALLVEVDSIGRWFVRQLNADGNNVMYDLDVRVSAGKVTTGNRVEAINWGDTHLAQINEEIEELSWGVCGMYETLKPKRQFLNDLVDFHARNHHDRGKCHVLFQRYSEGQDSVEDEMIEVVDFLKAIERQWCKTIVVNSNHDNAFGKWLQGTDYRSDPANALYFLKNQLACYEAIDAGEFGTKFHLIEFALQELGAPEKIVFLREDESYIICDSPSGGIQCGMHGHLGINGAKPSPLGLSKMGRKGNTGHTHSAGIIDGLYTAGYSGKRDLGYNFGPGSWSYSHIITYANGKRAICTMFGGAWRAK